MSRKYGLSRILTTCLGGFWLLDGILQLQPAMFTGAFVTTVLAPNLVSQPGAIASIIAFGIRVWSINFFWSNLASALIQLLIGVLLLVPLPETARRFGLWLSIAWGLIIWIFGEGFGGLATGSATFYTGAPGSALLYCTLAIFLLYGLEKKLPAACGVIFLIGAFLNLAPMFWQQGMISMLAMVPAVSGSFGRLGSTGTMVGNLVAIDMLLCLGIFLIVNPNRPVAWTVIIFLLATWCVGQDFGRIFTFPFGTATDPNSAPMLLLCLLPIFFFKDKPSPIPPIQ